jgi:DNA-directed RNA polymerase sigma subunit (sigma70/sigma32)
MASPVSALTKAIQHPLGRFSRLNPLQQVTVASEMNEALLDAQATVAALRRGAIRTLRSNGYTLNEIAQQTGMTPQRVHQLEIGHDRRDKSK